MRKYGFANYSNPNGVTFMENVLEEKIELGLANLVHLDKNIIIQREELHDIILRHDNTGLQNSEMSNNPLLIREVDDGFYVSLKNPPKEKENVETDIPLNDIPDLKVFQNYKKG